MINHDLLSNSNRVGVYNDYRGVQERGRLKFSVFVCLCICVLHTHIHTCTQEIIQPLNGLSTETGGLQSEPRTGSRDQWGTQSGDRKDRVKEDSRGRKGV